MIISLLFARSVSVKQETIGTLSNKFASLDITNFGNIVMSELDTNFIFSKGFCSVKNIGRFNASVISKTNSFLEIEGYTKTNSYIRYKIITKGTHFIFQLIESDIDDGQTIVFPTMVTNYDNGVGGGVSGISMNSTYSFCVRINNGNATVNAGPKSLNVNWIKYNGDFGKDKNVYVIAGRTPSFRKLLQDIFVAENFQLSKMGGPYAIDNDMTSMSYLFAPLSEKSCDDWINMGVEYGFDMLYLQAIFDSFGHFKPHKKKFPSGEQGWKTCIDKIHKAGMRVGFQSYGGGIDAFDEYVTGSKTHPNLGADFVYTLEQPITDETTEIIIKEQPNPNLDTHWTHYGHGNVLQIGSELISYESLKLTKPYGFGKITRGAFNTTISNHPTTQAVKHLRVMFARFQPDIDTDFVEEIAQNQADVFNKFGFDFIYIDAVEGMQRGREGVRRMVKAIAERLDKTVPIETSIWEHSIWPLLSRIGAFDPPSYAAKQFVDYHIQNNIKVRANLVPVQMGYWSLLNQSPLRYTHLFDEFEYMCSKSCAYDMSSSFKNLNTERLSNPNQKNMMLNYKQWHLVRKEKLLSQEEKNVIGKFGDEFHLIGDVTKGNWEIRRASYPAKITNHKSGAKENIVFNNPYQSQQLKFRAMNLISMEPYDSKNAVDFLEATGKNEFYSIEGNENVTATVSVDNKIVKVGQSSLKINVKNDRATKEGSWACLKKKFPSYVNVSQSGVGFWIYGDGKGEVLNIQPHTTHTFSETYDDHYVIVDFVGWRYIELSARERSVDQYPNYQWPYTRERYIYILCNNYEHIKELHIYVNNVPANSECNIYLSPIKALPEVETTLNSLSLSLNGQKMEFSNLSIKSGEYFELVDANNCNYYKLKYPDYTGKVQFTTSGDQFNIEQGENAIEVSYDIDTVLPNVKPRIKMTLFEYGDVVVSKGTVNSEESNVGEGIGPGGVAGITITVLVVVAAAAIGLYIMYKKHSSNEKDSEIEASIVA